jgi:hypothetical protein
MLGQGLGGHCKIMTALNFSHLQKNYGKGAQAITVMCGSSKRWPRQRPASTSVPAPGLNACTTLT